MVRYAVVSVFLAALAAGSGSAFAAPAASPADPSTAASSEAGLRRLDAPPARAGSAPSATPLAGSDPRPRLYSLHRDYGETPDRTVLPPEFFLAPAAQSDLAAPPQPAARDRSGRVVPADPDAPQT